MATTVDSLMVNRRLHLARLPSKVPSSLVMNMTTVIPPRRRHSKTVAVCLHCLPLQWSQAWTTWKLPLIEGRARMCKCSHRTTCPAPASPVTLVPFIQQWILDLRHQHLQTTPSRDRCSQDHLVTRCSRHVRRHVAAVKKYPRHQESPSRTRLGSTKVFQARPKVSRVSRHPQPPARLNINP